MAEEVEKTTIYQDVQKFPETYRRAIGAFFDHFRAVGSLWPDVSGVETVQPQDRFSKALSLAIRAFLLVMVVGLGTFAVDLDVPRTAGFAVIKSFAVLLMLLIGSLYMVTFGIVSAFGAQIIAKTRVSPFSPAAVALEFYALFLTVGVALQVVMSLGDILNLLAETAGSRDVLDWMPTLLAGLKAGVGLVFAVFMFRFFKRAMISYAGSLSTSLGKAAVIGVSALMINGAAWAVAYMAFRPFVG